MPDKPLSLAQVFQEDLASHEKIGVHLTAMFSSGVVCFARGPIFHLPPVLEPIPRASLTLQGSLLASFSDRTAQVDEQLASGGSPGTIDSGVQRFSRQEADMILFRISAPVIVAGPAYTVQIKFDAAATAWTQIDLMPNWNFLTGVTGTLRGGQAVYTVSFFEYA